MIYVPRERWSRIIYQWLWGLFWILLGTAACIVLVYALEIMKQYGLHLGILQPWMFIDHGDCTQCI